MMAAVLPVDGADSVDIQAIVRRMQQGLPPADVQEYLWRVRIEAEGIPDVVVSDVDPRQFDANQTANMPSLPSFADTSVDAKLLPTDDWKYALLADFAELRQLIARWQELGPPDTEPQDAMDLLDGDAAGKGDTFLEPTLRTAVPRMSDEDGWKAFFFGKPDSAIDGTPPHLRLLLQFDQVLTRRLLAYHTDWLEDDVVLLSRARAVWIYALLARLDKPVHAGVAATIRQLLRRCWLLRNELSSSYSSDSNDDSVWALRLKSLNVLITITGDFFAQLHEPE
uniref:Gem-associated protein 2 n=1 Tax=Globisporangium ultimum (strain ATCC 200006 / CBS 805.95 / DAOM BR144) TaxID=431595 RepID=K3WHS7_GLOUD